VIQTKVFKGIH